MLRVDERKRTAKYKTPAAASPQPADTPKTYGDVYQRRVQGYCPPRQATEQIAREKAPKKRAGKGFIVLVAVLAAVFVYAAVQLAIYLVQSYQAKQEERMIQTMIAQSEADIAQEADPATSAPQSAAPVSTQTPSPAAITGSGRQSPQKPQVLIQFNQALAANPDTVGQLKMGESIHTYVVQRDNTYYLRHSFSGEYSFSGAIFMDVSCSIEPQSRNLIIHGHNMQDGTAFGKLSRFDNIDYLNKYPFVEFSTLYESARYIPFAVVYYSIDPKSDRYLDIYRINAMSDREFSQFVSKVQLMSVYHIPVSVAGRDKILTVTTCATGDDEMRFAVFAVKSATD